MTRIFQKMANNTLTNQRGFTLQELVMVIVLIGIVSASVVMMNINSSGQHSVNVQADQLRRNLSHLQLLAISRGQRMRLTTTATNYTVAACTTSACTTTTPVSNDPATESNFSVNLTDGVTFTAASQGMLDFDSLGRPQAGGALITVSRQFVLTGSGNNATVTVQPLTGFAK